MRGLETRTTWVLGSPRSGTTWLAALLSHAIGAVVIDEPLIGAHLAVPMSSVTSVFDPNQQSVHEASAGRPAYFFSDASADVWQPRLRTLLLARFAAAVVDSGRPRRAAVVVKEPNGALAASLLLGAMPRSRLLFVVRDGRDVVDSMIDGASGGWISQTHGTAVTDIERHRFLERRAHEWVRTMNGVGAAYAAHPEHQRLRVTYEGLLAEPLREMERVVRWLGFPAAVPDLGETISLLSFENLPASSKGPGRFARSATPGLWRDHFDSEEQALLHGIMGETLRELGYEPA